MGPFPSPSYLAQTSTIYIYNDNLINHSLRNIRVCLVAPLGSGAFWLVAFRLVALQARCRVWLLNDDDVFCLFLQKQKTAQAETFEFSCTHLRQLFVRNLLGGFLRLLLFPDAIFVIYFELSYIFIFHFDAKGQTVF